MKLTSISLLIAAVALLELWRTASRLKRDRVGIRPGLTWACMWLGIGYFALFPSHLDHALALAQMENRMFFITVLSLLILFTRGFSQESKLERVQRDVAHLVQELALARAQGELSAPRTLPSDEGPPNQPSAPRTLASADAKRDQPSPPR